MREWVNDCWNSVMNLEHNPLRNIPDLHARHMIMQILAWIWCMVFSFYVGSYVVFGISAIAHILFLAAVVITVATFETAKRNPQLFSLRTDGYHSLSRTRQYMWINGQRIVLDPNDPGGEHE